MKQNDQIAAALAWINETANAMSMVGDKQKGKALKTLAADYERQRDEIKGLREEENGRGLQIKKTDALITRLLGQIREADTEIARLKRENASLAQALREITKAAERATSEDGDISDIDGSLIDSARKALKAWRTVDNFGISPISSG